MGRIEKTVFLSYRRTNAPWALAISQNLTHHGYDVFFDFNGIASGDFESVILENIRARAHFIVLLTPSALERCGEPGDWLRREIETALSIQRNIVPLMLESFDFGAPGIARQLSGTLAALKSYNALRVPAEYFDEAMERLRTKFLNVPVEAVLHPASPLARQAAKVEQSAASAAPTVTEKELTAQEWFERGVNASDLDEQIRFYSEAIRLEPDIANAFYNRGRAHHAKGDVEGALKDYNEAIRLQPDHAAAFYNRGFAYDNKGDLNGAIENYSEAIRLKPDYAGALNNRGLALYYKGDVEGAPKDCNEAIRLQPDAEAFNARGTVLYARGNLEDALKDYSEAIRLQPEFAIAYYNRALISRQQERPVAAIADFRRYLDLGGAARHGETEKVRGMIRELQEKL